MGLPTESIQRHVISYSYEIPNIVNLDARRIGGISERVDVTETRTFERVSCDPCQDDSGIGCLAANALLALAGLPLTPALRSLWQRPPTDATPPEAPASCTIDIPVGGAEISAELLIDGDPAKPLSQAARLFQRGDGDMILLDHCVAIPIESRRFPYAFGVARQFLVNPGALSADAGRIDILSVVFVKVEFADGSWELVPFDDLARPSHCPASVQPPRHRSSSTR